MSLPEFATMKSNDVTEEMKKSNDVIRLSFAINEVLNNADRADAIIALINVLASAAGDAPPAITEGLLATLRALIDKNREDRANVRTH